MFSAVLFVLIDCQFAQCPHLSGGGRCASERVPIKAPRCKETSRCAVRDRIFDWPLSRFAPLPPQSSMKSADEDNVNFYSLDHLDTDSRSENYSIDLK